MKNKKRRDLVRIPCFWTAQKKSPEVLQHSSICEVLRQVDVAAVLPPAGGGVWVDDFLDWLWCVVADVVVVWEGSVAMVVPHHPSFQTFPHHHYSSNIIAQH